MQLSTRHHPGKAAFKGQEAELNHRQFFFRETLLIIFLPFVLIIKILLLTVEISE